MKEHVRRFPAAGPLVEIGYRFVCRWIRATSDWYTLRRLANCAYPQGRQLVRILRQLKGAIAKTERHSIARIETGRRRLLVRDEPLVDGSLGEPGPYDKGLTIQAACKVSKPPQASLLLYLLIRAFKPLNVIELGTNVGVSSAYLATALKLNDQNGSLITLEASPYRVRLARELHKDLELENVKYMEGLFYDTLNNSLSVIDSVDLAFIDGHHQYQPTLDYFHAIWKHSTADAIFVFDDIRWSDGMRNAWAEICADRRVGLAADLETMGICVSAKKSSSKRYIFRPIYSALNEGI